MNRSASSQPLLGLVVTIVAVLVLVGLAAEAPAGLRKIGLFSLAIGIGIGWITSSFGRHFGTSRRVMLAITPVLIVAGLIYVAIRTHSQFVTLQRAAEREHPEQSLPTPMLETIAANDPQTAEMLELENAAREPDFSRYLAVRTRPLGEWTSPWPLIFWICELVLAAGTGTFVVSRRLTSAGRDDSAADEQAAPA